MKFVDQVRVLARAGDGGNGAVAWRREAHVARGGPAGGDGGRGGNVVFVADESMTTLLDLRFRQHLQAEEGHAGGTKDRNGRAGEDLVVRVPVGTVVSIEGEQLNKGDLPPWASGGDGGGMEIIYVGREDVESDEPASPSGDPSARAGTILGDLTDHGQVVVVAKGGHGGRGNIHFRSSTNRAPDRAEPGTPGEALWLRLELKLIADVGIVGYPNVGKSTLISKISRAKPKIANYPFTTLVPNLGVVSVDDERIMVVADVPGLIEGAASGKGLGHEFLRHLERTKVLLHLVAPDPDPERDLMKDLDTIEEELERYGTFGGRPRVVALNKADTLKDEAGQERVEEFRQALRARSIPLFLISAGTGEGLRPLLEALWRRLELSRGG